MTLRISLPLMASIFCLLVPALARAEIGAGITVVAPERAPNRADEGEKPDRPDAGQPTPSLETETTRPESFEKALEAAGGVPKLPDVERFKCTLGLDVEKALTDLNDSDPLGLLVLAQQIADPETRDEARAEILQAQQELIERAEAHFKAEIARGWARGPAAAESLTAMVCLVEYAATLDPPRTWPSLAVANETLDALHVLRDLRTRQAGADLEMGKLNSIGASFPTQHEFRVAAEAWLQAAEGLSRYLRDPAGSLLARIRVVAAQLENAIRNEQSGAADTLVEKAATMTAELGGRFPDAPSPYFVQAVLKTAFEANSSLENRAKLKDAIESTLVSRIPRAIEQGSTAEAQAMLAYYTALLGDRGEMLIEAARDYLLEPPLVFDVAALDSDTCDEQGAQSSPAVRAILIAGSDVEGSHSGTSNDVALIKRSLETRGSLGDVTVLKGSEVTRDHLVHSMRELVERTRCGDVVVLHFSGYSVSPAPSSRSDPNKLSMHVVLPAGWQTYLAMTPRQDLTYQDIRPSLMRGIDFSQFVTAVRNRGASAVLFFDTSGAAGLGIQEFQKAVDPRADWRSRIASDDVPERSAPGGPAYLATLARKAGNYAVFYASDFNQESLVFPLRAEGAGSLDYGLFSWAVASALQTEARPTVRKVADAIGEQLREGRRRLIATGADRHALASIGTAIVEGNDPEMELLRPTKAALNETLEVSVVSPHSVHGTTKFELRSPVFDLVGKIEDSNKLAGLLVNNRKTKVDAFGQFQTRVSLKAGESEVGLTGIYFDHTIRTKTLQFTYEADLERLVASGERYALVIGINSYQHMKALETARADAEAVAKALAEQYGFRTELDESDGSKRPLVLLDATKQDITGTLSRLIQRLDEQDTLLIYFAGHGQLLEQSQEAFWIPNDGKRDDHFTWISAHDIVGALKLLRARSVLVVSDSCFSGAMRVGITDWQTVDPDRRRALMKLGSRKSRIFIASGGVEPVLDKGCGEHSVFACSFLKGLNEMKTPLFSSGDLFEQHIKFISGKVDQQPERQAIKDSNHDNGEFIFARVEAQEKGKAVDAATPGPP